MKIKYKILASLLIVGGLSLQSCDSVFDELAINPNQPSMKTYFTTPEGVNDAVTTMYGYISTQRCLGASGSKTRLSVVTKPTPTPITESQVCLART